ncbi:MAG: hypothetical protein JWO03_1361 [Bacteroidetes bacterium]|nr:hypothetical protein [Bacteroidota bacterium]
MVLVTMLFGCNKLKHIPFEYSYHTSVNVPAAPVVGATVTVPLTVKTNIDSVMEANHTKPDLLQSAKLKTLTLSITAPPGQTFEVLKGISVYVVTDQGDMLIAQKQNISSSASSLDMDVENVELKPYLVAENMNLKATVTTANGMTREMTLYFDMRVHFEANLLAAF